MSTNTWKARDREEGAISTPASGGPSSAARRKGHSTGGCADSVDICKTRQSLLLLPFLSFRGHYPVWEKAFLVSAAGVQEAVRRKLGSKAPGSGKDKSGSPKHGDGFWHSLPVVSMSRVWEAHSHFKTQGNLLPYMRESMHHLSSAPGLHHLTRCSPIPRTFRQ